MCDRTNFCWALSYFKAILFSSDKWSGSFHELYFTRGNRLKGSSMKELQAWIFLLKGIILRNRIGMGHMKDSNSR